MTTRTDCQQNRETKSPRVTSEPHIPSWQRTASSALTRHATTAAADSGPPCTWNTATPTAAGAATTETTAHLIGLRQFKVYICSGGSALDTTISRESETSD